MACIIWDRQQQYGNLFALKHHVLFLGLKFTSYLCLTELPVGILLIYDKGELLIAFRYIYQTEKSTTKVRI